MSEKPSVVAVLCDHQCSANGPIDVSTLEKRLSDSQTIGKVIMLDKACQDPEKKLKKVEGQKILFGGCPHLEESGFYTQAAATLKLAPGQMRVTDLKSTIVDLYDEAKAIEDNLVGRLESVGRLLSDSVLVKDKPVKQGRNVLVYGSGLSGLQAALELSGEKLSVDLVETTDPVLAPGCLAASLQDPGVVDKLAEKARSSEHIAVFPQSQLGPIQTVEKGFRVSFAGGEPREYGAVIFAPERVEKAAAEVGAWNLTQLYERIRKDQPIKGRIVFILDRDFESAPEVIQDVLTAALKIKDRSHAEIWILLKQLRVALPALQDLYDQAREAGVIFVKYEGLRIHNEYGDFQISGRDPQSGAEFRVSEPDRVIIPGGGELSDSAFKAAESMGLRLLGNQYTQPYSLWRLANESNHPGVLVCGSARGNMDVHGAASDAAAVVSALKGWLKPGGITAIEHVASVDEDKCVYCLTCVRVCPYHAMGKNPGEKVAQPVTTICQGCGICAAECPAEAITLRNLSQDSVLAATHALASS